MILELTKQTKKTLSAKHVSMKTYKQRQRITAKLVTCLSHCVMTAQNNILDKNWAGITNYVTTYENSLIIRNVWPQSRLSRIIFTLLKRMFSFSNTLLIYLKRVLLMVVDNVTLHLFTKEKIYSKQMTLKLWLPFKNTLLKHC